MLAKGPNVFSGYRNLPDKSRDAFTEDGWFRTGDLGYVDSHGELHLEGRTTSMIVLPGGENVDPEKVEVLLESSSRIAEVGVLEQGGRLMGIAVPAKEAVEAETDEELERALRLEVRRLSEAMPTYQRPSDIILCHSPLPRTRLGKLQRHKLSGLYGELVAGGERVGPREKAPPLSTEDRQLLEDPVARQLWVWLGARFPEHQVTPDTSLGLDLGVDSLEWLNLTLEIRNRAGVELSDEAVGRIRTVRDLLREAAIADHAAGVEGDAVALLRDPESLLDDTARGWFEPHRRRSGILNPLAVFLARLVMRWLFRFRVNGRDNLPRSGPYILVPNHRSSLDPIAVAAAIGLDRLRTTYWGGWVGILFRGRLMSMLSHAMRVLPVEPRSGPLSNLALASTALHRGHGLVWFPEGGRSRTGELQRFRSGVGLLLLAHSVPVVPIWIQGSGEALPPGSLRPRLHPVSLRFGEPLAAEELERAGSGDTPEERIADALRARVKQLGPG